MACIKITKTNNSNSKLIETLEKIFENEYKAEAAYSYFESDNFINEFGNYIEGYSKADKSFNGRVDDNGEPMLFYDDTAQKYFFIDKDSNKIFYPFVKRGLRSVFNYKQTDRIVSRLALNYFNKSGLNFLNFNTIEFEERQSLPKLKEFIKGELDTKIKELEEKGGKFKLQALVLKKSLLHLNEYVEKVDAFYKKISLKRVDVDNVTNLQSENEEIKDPSFTKSSFEQDSKAAISTNVKLKLSLLEDTENIDPIWNEPTFKDFDDVHSTLLNNITNLVALEGEDLFELQKVEIKRVAIKKPYLKQLLGFLNDKKFSENDKNQFAQAFNLHGNNFLVSEVRTKFKDRDSGDVKKGYTHSVMEVSESGSKAAIVTSEWGNNFKNKFLDDTNKFKESSKEVLTQIQEELKKLKESINPDGNNVDFKNNINDFVTITRKLGVELTENGIINFLDNNGALSFDTTSQIDNLSKATTQLEIGVKKALKSFIKTKSDFKNPFNEEGVFKKLAKAESFFISEGSDSSIWSSGKNKWLFSYPSYLSTRIKQWQKNPETLKNWFNSSAYNQGSAIMEYLLAEDLDQNMIYEEGEKERIINERLEHLKLGIFNTFQEKNEDFSDVSELSFKDYFNDAINKTLSQSFNRTTTPADKGTDYQIRTGFFIDAYSNTNGNKEVNFTEQTETVFFNYFNSEVNRMKEAHKEVDSFKNSPEKLTVNYHFKEDSSVDSKNGNAFKSQYFPELSYDSTSSNEKVNIIKDALYLKKDGKYTNEIKHTADLKSNKELTNLIKEYISDNLREGVNNTISNFLKQEVFILDNNGELENKGIDNNTYNTYSENNLLNKEETLKAIATDFYINSLINNIEYSKLFTGDVAFYKDMVDYKKRVPATYTDGLQLRIKKGEEFFNIATTSKVKITPQEYSKIEEILGKEGAKAYQGTNSADGQAWITPARWKFLMERLGKWSNVHDSVYKKMNSDNPEPYTKEELKISAQPVKGVYFYMNGKTPSFLKYSQAVLTKNLVKGTGLQTIYDQMQAQEVDELITLDGIKVGSSTPTTIHNADGTVKDSFKFNVSQLSNYGWKLQQDLPTKTTKETDIGSQIQKNIFAGLLFNKELSGFELDNNVTNGQTIINNIVDIVEGLIGTGLSEIKDEFKVFRNGEIKNIKGFYNALVRELEKRGGSQNIIDALNKQTALYGIPQSMDKITNIFSSVMNDHLIKIKTNGGSFVQMSNFGINKNEAVEQGVIMHPDLKNGTTTYEPHYYKDENGKTKVKPGGVFISGSFIAKYIPDYKKYDNVELFVGKDGKPPIIDEKIRKNLIGYRIPNQGLSSNDALEIIGILPEENGDTIVAFTGITTKTGSDFDIDKMYIMMANYTLEEDRLVYTSYDNSIPNKKQSKQALQNRLIELYKSVLTHPKVLKDVMKPLDNDLLKDDIIDLIPNNTDGIMFHFDAYTDMVLRYEYTGGKAGVGQEANALVDINRIGELSINNYFIGWGTKNSKGDTKFDEEYSEELSEEDIDYYVKELIKPGASNERIKAFREEIRKVKISDSLTAILNAFVDIAKDPYISRGNWTTSTTNTGNLMLRAGVHPLYVTAFMAQPIIKNYIQYQSSLESILNNNSGDTKSKFKRNLVIENLEKQDQNYFELNKPLSLIYQKLVKSDNTNNLTASNATEKLQKVLGSEKLSDDKLEEILTVLKEAHSNIFNEQKIKITDRSQYNLKILRNQVKSKSDGSIQIAILDKFFELQELSKTLKENVDVSKLDTNGMGKNVNTLFSFFNMRQHIKNKEESKKDKVLNGFESKFVNSPLEKYYKALEEVMRIVQSNPLLFPQGQKDVQDMFNEISNDLYSTPAINEELMTDLEKSFYTYTMSNFGPFNMSSVESRDLLDKLPARFTEFKKANKNKYLILDELQIRNDGKLKLIGLNNRKKSKDFETKFTDSWKDLLIENPQLAEDLIKYSFIVSGFRMNSTQFFTYIPHEYLLNEGINEFIKAFSRENKYDFIDKFYLNNTDKFKYVNKTFDNELFSEDFATGFIVREAGKSKYYLKRDTGDGIYKLEGYNKNNQAVYIRVNKLGYKVKGSNIVEYGDEFSKNVLDLNKDYVHKLKSIVVTSRDQFKSDFELDKTKDREDDAVEIEEIDNNNKVVEGDIFSLEGIPVITTNLGGVHGAGLAQLAKSKGLITQHDGNFKATDKVVQLPVKKKWSDSMSMNDNMTLLQNSLNNLSKTASENPNNTYLLPLAGLGHGEGSVEEILPILINTVKSNNNIKLVLPSENINLGRQGTVRKDYTRENLPKIKEILKQNGLILNESKQLSLFEETKQPETVSEPIKSEVKLNYQEATNEFIESLPEKGYTTEHGNFRIGLSDKTSKYAYDLQNQNINIDDVFNQSEPFYVLKRLALSADTRGNFERGARYYLIDTKNKGIFKISNKKELDINSLYKVNLQEHVKPYSEKDSFNSKIERISFYQSLKEAVDNFKNSPKEIKEPKIQTIPRQVKILGKLEIGQYVKYNDQTYIITKENSNGTVQIYNPNIEGPTSKLSVSKDKLTLDYGSAKIVTYKGSEYLVTPNNNIISTVTNKIMNWAENDGNRKSILALANNEILAPETVKLELPTIQSQQIRTDTFVFKPANAQQENAISGIQDFIKNGDPSEIFMLEGKAGTGKTTIVQEAIAEAVAAGKKIQIAALSHKAKLVLAQKLDKRFPKKTGSSSIAGLLGMTMNEETGEFEPGFGMDRPIESADIIIIDEASMVNEEALSLIMQEKRRTAKVIFLGDRGQLPPIRKISSDEISLVFQSENKASLTERVRQGEESPILPFADYFWDNSESSTSKVNPIPDGEITDKLSDKGNLVFIKNLYDSFEDVVKIFKQGIDTGNFNVIKIVTYKNDTRRSYNEKIRKSIFGEDVAQFVEKDQIMFQNNYSLDARTSFSNSDEFNIVSVKEQEKNGYKVFQIGVNMEEESSVVTYFPVISNEDKQRFNEDISRLFEEAGKMPKGDLRKYAYQKAWSLKRMFAEIDYSYAITSHKSQGSTYDNVIVDLKDIYSVGATSSKSKSRSAYTALTRAKNTAILITSKAETNDENVRKSLGIEENSEQLWNKYQEAIVAKFPNFTLDQFNNMTKEERNKLIECL